jgi:hypothetical protein
MNYQKIYDSIIEKAKLENRKKYSEIYYEEHHIIPKCLGGLNNKINKILLIPKEHFICHKLLTYIYPHHRGIVYSFHRMCYGLSRKNKRKKEYKISSRDYAYCRELLARNCSGENNPFFGKTHTKETIEKLRYTKTEEHKQKLREANIGKKSSAKSRQKQSESIKKWHKEIGFSEEDHKKMRENNPWRGKKLPKYMVEHMLETRAKSPNIRGVKRSEETKKRMRHPHKKKLII